MKNKIFTTDSMCAIMKRNKITFMTLFVREYYYLITWFHLIIYVFTG